MNLEVIYPASANVIDYDKSEIVFHGTLEYDDSGRAIGQPKDSARMLAGMIKQINQNKQDTFEIRGPQAVELPKSKDFSKNADKYIKRISALQKKYGLGNSDNLLQYHRKFWLQMVEKEARKSRVKLSRDLKVKLVKRFAEGDKSFALRFCCIIESSICVPKLLGSKAIETPVPKIPDEE